MRRTVATVGAVLVTAAVTVSLAGCTGTDAHQASGPTRTHEPSAVSVPASDRFAVLQRASSEQDALPDDATTPDDLVLNSARYAGQQHGTRYWIAAERGDGVCLIAWTHDPGSAENWSVCGGVPVARATIVTSMIDDHDRRTALVSDGFESPGADPMHEIAPNVWVH